MCAPPAGSIATTPSPWRSPSTPRRRSARGTTRGGGKSRTDSEGETPAAWDHDPPAETKWTPFGVLMLATGALTLIFTQSRETSAFWADALKVWWLSVKDQHSHIKRLVISLDNGPKNSGTRTQWLRRLVEFCDWSGLEIRLVYYPPDHSKYNPIERCWSVLEQKWGGSLLNSLKVILQQGVTPRNGQNRTLRAWLVRIYG